MASKKTPVEPTGTREEGLRLLSERAIYEYSGRQYNLLMTHRVLIEWERITDLSYFSDLGRVLDKPSLTALSAMLYCLLVNAGYTGTRDAIIEFLTEPDHFKAAFAACLAAYANARVVREPLAEPDDPQVPTIAM